MFDSYKDIFEKRGISYHKAMMTYPLVRLEEFRPLIEILDPKKDEVIVDIPSGGCYLKHYIAESAKIISIDSSEAFLSFCDHSDETLCCDVEAVPLASGSIDKVYSLAGIHHLEQKSPLFTEVARLLRPGGLFALADVERDSSVDAFLNIFVDQHNTMGHKGLFLDKARTVMELEQSGLSVESAERKKYTWNFHTVEEMIDYTRLMFGLDKADDVEIVNGIERHLGYNEVSTGIEMNWELLYFKVYKK